MAYVYDDLIGHFVSQEHVRIAELVKEYDPDLEVVWVNPNERTVLDEYPFAVVHRPQGRNPYIAFRLRENELNHTVLTKLMTRDIARTDVLKTLEADQRARRLYERKVIEEQRAEQFEKAVAVLSSPKSRYRMDGRVYGY